jgi:hypothetical protein
VADYGLERGHHKHDRERAEHRPNLGQLAAPHVFIQR